MSVVNFAKTYTIEHNVRVIIFGTVDRKHKRTLQDQWTQVQGIASATLNDEERQGHQVDDRNRNERNQDRFGDDD